MTDDTRDEITACLGLLKKILLRNEVSIALAKDKIQFFDTAHYLRTKGFSGIEVNIMDLVR